MTKDAVIDCVHKTIFGFFNIAEDDSEEPINEKDKLLLEVNKAVCNAIKDIPDDERKVGHWIEERTYMECPNCHDIWHYEENQAERFKCCPNCGAKMEGAEE